MLKNLISHLPVSPYPFCLFLSLAHFQYPSVSLQYFVPAQFTLLFKETSLVIIDTVGLSHTQYQFSYTNKSKRLPLQKVAIAINSLIKTFVAN